VPRGKSPPPREKKEKKKGARRYRPGKEKKMNPSPVESTRPPLERKRGKRGSLDGTRLSVISEALTNGGGGKKKKRRAAPRRTENPAGEGGGLELGGEAQRLTSDTTAGRGKKRNASSFRPEGGQKPQTRRPYYHRELPGRKKENGRKKGKI